MLRQQFRRLPKAAQTTDNMCGVAPWPDNMLHGFEIHKLYDLNSTHTHHHDSILGIPDIKALIPGRVFTQTHRPHRAILRHTNKLQVWEVGHMGHTVRQ